MVGVGVTGKGKKTMILLHKKILMHKEQRRTSNPTRKRITLPSRRCDVKWSTK